VERRLSTSGSDHFPQVLRVRRTLGRPTCSSSQDSVASFRIVQRRDRVREAAQFEAWSVARIHKLRALLYARYES
jgi:hypothetical protein